LIITGAEDSFPLRPFLFGGFMYLLDKERVRKVLLTQKFNPAQVERLLRNYPPLPDTLGVLVEQWLSDQIIPELEIAGISLKHAMEIRHSHFLVTIRDMRNLLDPNITEEKRELWREILTTPIQYK